MRRTITTLCAAAMAVTSIAAFSGASQAAPLPVPTVKSDSNVVQIRDRFERRGDGYYYNGHRGDRRRHAGWRNYNGYWFPPAAFLGGAIVGGLLENGIRSDVRYSNRHYRWCENNRPNYRISDNTWKRPGEPRRSCNSPFD